MDLSGAAVVRRIQSVPLEHGTPQATFLSATIAQWPATPTPESRRDKGSGKKAIQHDRKNKKNDKSLWDLFLWKMIHFLKDQEQKADCVVVSAEGTSLLAGLPFFIKMVMH